MPNSMKVLTLTVLIAFSASSTTLLAASDHAVIAALATPKGAAALTFTYAVLKGISTWIWAYDWTRNGASAEQNKRIQEAGGLSCAVESWLLAGIIPFLCWQYLQQNPPTTPQIQLSNV